MTGNANATDPVCSLSPDHHLIEIARAAAQADAVASTLVVPNQSGMSLPFNAPASQALSKNSGIVQTFRALRHRDFRLLWFGLAVSAIGTWMQIVAQSLLVLKITHGSAFALGTVSLAQALSFLLFALIGGSVADRINKRRLLLFTQASSAVLAILLGFLTYFGVIQLWMILVLAFLSGTLLSFDQPTRGALVPVLVPKEDLGNAISLQAMVFNGASTIGPALAGIGVAKLGYAANFFLNGASFIGVLIALYFMHVPPSQAHQQSTMQAIRTAFSTVKSDAVLPWVLSGYAAMLFMGPVLGADSAGVRRQSLAHRIGASRLSLLGCRRGNDRGCSSSGIAQQQSAARTNLPDRNVPLGCSAPGICAEPMVLAVSCGSVDLRVRADARRNDNDHLAANSRGPTYARTYDEPQYSRHHGRSAARRLPCRRINHRHRRAGDGLAERNVGCCVRHRCC